MQRGRTCITFEVRASAAFPTDALVFRLDGKILGYWNGPMHDPIEIGSCIPDA